MSEENVEEPEYELSRIQRVLMYLAALIDGSRKCVITLGWNGQTVRDMAIQLVSEPSELPDNPVDSQTYQ